MKSKTSKLRSSLFDYIDAYILVKGTISVTYTAVAPGGTNNENKKVKVIFRNCAAFTDCINEINNTEIDNAKDIDVVISIYNLI